MAEGYQEHRPVLGVMSTDNIPSTDDLNNYQQIGIWRLGGDLPSHAPSDATWSQLCVIAIGTSLMQIIINGNTLWIRNGSTLWSYVWSGWFKITGTAV